jgi:hypothetical protein
VLFVHIQASPLVGDLVNQMVNQVVSCVRELRSALSVASVLLSEDDWFMRVCA